MLGVGSFVKLNQGIRANCLTDLQKSQHGMTLTDELRIFNLRNISITRA